MIQDYSKTQFTDCAMSPNTRDPGTTTRPDRSHHVELLGHPSASVFQQSLHSGLPFAPTASLSTRSDFHYLPVAILWGLVSPVLLGGLLNFASLGLGAMVYNILPSSPSDESCVKMEQPSLTFIQVGA